VTDAEYDEFFRVAYPHLVAIGLAMSVERHVAQELAQEVLWRAFRHRDQLDHYDAPMGWCRRVMCNLVIDQHRSSAAGRRALVRTAARAAVESESDDPSTSIGGPTWGELMTALTLQQRAVATLYYAEDQSIDTIAAALNISTGTVKSTLAKARTNVRRAMSGTNEERSQP